MLCVDSFVVWMQGMDCFKDSTEETAGSRDVVFENDAENLVEGKETQSGSTEHGMGWSSIVGNAP